MYSHSELSDTVLRKKIKEGEIRFAGNSNLRIYGTLRCKSGKRMKKQNRAFFVSREEAIQYGFRPCAHCLPGEFKKWKSGTP
ncbi:MAG TPA: Ada metal-binding domain-containing protein [Chitinophagaceae bacterium]|nr:Ada metal-binding domain-containing protein [Chitinophagaceae bacterium]